MFDNDQRQAGVLQPSQQASDLLEFAGTETGAEFVDEQNVRPRGQRPGQVEQFLLAARERRRQVVRGPGQPDKLERVGVEEYGVAVAARAHDGHVVRHSEVPQRMGNLERAIQTESTEVVRGFAAHVVSLQRDGAPAGLVDAGYHIDEGGLAGTVWTYEAECPSYSTAQHTAKREFVERALREIKPARVLDAGANTGEFSLMAAAAGASVVSIDRDPETVAALWRSATAAGADILPLVVDLARPTPPAGWRGREQFGFLERAEGFFDCALLLAVTHHLMVTDRIPPDQIFDALASLTTRWLIIEYVGPQDPMFRRLARGRDVLYHSYTRDVFEECARRSFDIVNSLGIPSSDRAIYLLCRKS